jgi:curved DNA-binding protein CbpA
VSRPSFGELGGRDPYDILELPAGASEAEVRAARKRLLRRYHPDLPAGDLRRTQMITAAADLLLDPLRRTGYYDLRDEEARRTVFTTADRREDRRAAGTRTDGHWFQPAGGFDGRTGAPADAGAGVAAAGPTPAGARPPTGDGTGGRRRVLRNRRAPAHNGHPAGRTGQPPGGGEEAGTAGRGGGPKTAGTDPAGRTASGPESASRIRPDLRTGFAYRQAPAARDEATGRAATSAGGAAASASAASEAGAAASADRPGPIRPTFITPPAKDARPAGNGYAGPVNGGTVRFSGNGHGAAHPTGTARVPGQTEPDSPADAGRPTGTTRPAGAGHAADAARPSGTTRSAARRARSRRFGRTRGLGRRAPAFAGTTGLGGGRLTGATDRVQHAAAAPLTASSRWNALAIASVVAILTWTPLPLALGLLALRQIRRFGQRGTRLALTGIVVGAVLLIVYLYVLVVPGL